MVKIRPMHEMTELPAWERLQKRLIWAQLGKPEGKRILDFGSGAGITANHFAEKNEVVAVEPSKEMLTNAWKDFPYRQIIGDVSALSAFDDESFDMIICHNVLEYVDDKANVVRALVRLLKRGGTLSVVKHHRAGRVMQMAVLLDDFEAANALLDGENGMSAQFGAIRYYEDGNIMKWSPELSMVDCFGLRTFWDLQQNQQNHADETWQNKMLRLEMRVSRLPEYRNIAFFHHLILKRHPR